MVNLMPKPLVLFISAGRTDLKLFAVEEEHYCAVEIETKSTRAFHQWLCNNPNAYVVQHEGTEYQRPKKDISLEITVENDNELKLSGRNTENLELLIDEQDRYIIVPVKLGRNIEKLQKSTEYQVIAAVVLNTHRDTTNRFSQNEPFAAGLVLAQWLANCFNLTFSEDQQPAEGKSVWVNLLKDNEDFDAKKDSDLLNPLPVNRLIDTLKTFSVHPDVHIGVYGIGGIPKFKNLIRDSAFFYFNGRCLIAEDSENEDSPPTNQSFGTRYITVEQSFALRASVAKLIQSGDFLGAEASVRHIEDTVHEQWTKPINDVARLFRGMDADSKTNNQNQEINALLAKIRNTDKGCILAALRTEAALQSRSWVDAMNWTSSFYDAAFFDAIVRLLDTWGGEYQVNINDRTVTYSTNDFIKQMRQKKGYRGAIVIPRDMKQRRIGRDNPTTSFPLEYRGQEGNSYSLDTMGKNNEKKWRGKINSTAINNFSIAFNPSPQPQQPPFSPKQYRNISTHRVLSTTDLEKAKNAYKNAKLWGSSGDLRFLEQPLVVAVLKDLNIPEVGQWYKQLVELLLKNLQDFRFPK
jgi:hypothetical protein